MIKRIVKMTFRPEECQSFEVIFEKYRAQIASAPGCLSVELLRDMTSPNVFFTFSIWQNAEALKAYRNSEIFGTVWPQTKALFAAKAEAWTVNSEWISGGV